MPAETKKKLDEMLAQPQIFLRALPKNVKIGDILIIRKMPETNYGLHIMNKSLKIRAVYLGLKEGTKQHIIHIGDVTMCAAISKSGCIVKLQEKNEV